MKMHQITSKSSAMAWALLLQPTGARKGLAKMKKEGGSVCSLVWWTSEPFFISCGVRVVSESWWMQIKLNGEENGRPSKVVSHNPPPLLRTKRQSLHFCWCFPIGTATKSDTERWAVSKNLDLTLSPLAAGEEWWSVVLTDKIIICIILFQWKRIKNLFYDICTVKQWLSICRGQTIHAQLYIIMN